MTDPIGAVKIGLLMNLTTTRGLKIKFVFGLMENLMTVLRKKNGGEVEDHFYVNISKQTQH